MTMEIIRKRFDIGQDYTCNLLIPRTALIILAFLCESTIMIIVSKRQTRREAGTQSYGSRRGGTARPPNILLRRLFVVLRRLLQRLTANLIDPNFFPKNCTSIS